MEGDADGIEASRRADLAGPGSVRRAAVAAHAGTGPNSEKTGICCINMGWDVPDKNILTVIETVEEYRKRFVYQ